MSTAVGSEQFGRTARLIFGAMAAVALLTGCGGDDGGENPPDTPPVTPPSISTFADSRDGREYGKVTIGTQTWMAENLDYDVPNDTTDKCYENSSDSCAKYGRVYTWGAAKKACPADWHLPDTAEWIKLIKYAGGDETAGKKLKSVSGWGLNINGNGTDRYGFSALPGGYGGAGSFLLAGHIGYWWSATEKNDDYALYMYMDYRNDKVNDGIDRPHNSKSTLYSVRCVED